MPELNFDHDNDNVNNDDVEDEEVQLEDSQEIDVLFNDKEIKNED